MTADTDTTAAAIIDARRRADIAAHDAAIDAALAAYVSAQSCAKWAKTSNAYRAIKSLKRGSRDVDMAEDRGEWGKPACHDCGLAYGAPGWADLVLPDAAWARIAPVDGDGLLCPTCMVRAADREGITSEAIFTSGPFVAVKLGQLHARAAKAESDLAAAQERIKTLERMDRQAAEHVETVICLRTGFTGDHPYVGWKGLGLALTEALDERDAAQTRIKALEFDARSWRMVAEMNGQAAQSYCERIKALEATVAARASSGLRYIDKAVADAHPHIMALVTDDPEAWEFDADRQTWYERPAAPDPKPLRRTEYRAIRALKRGSRDIDMAEDRGEWAQERVR